MSKKRRKASEVYLKKLKDPRWQKKRLKILERDGWACQECFDPERTLHVHHRYYERGKEPWDYPDEALQTLCEKCHGEEREWRPQAESDLIDVLRRHVGHHAVDELAKCLALAFETHPPDDPDITLYAVCGHLRTPERASALVDRYYGVYLREHTKHLESE